LVLWARTWEEEDEGWARTCLQEGEMVVVQCQELSPLNGPVFGQMPRMTKHSD
jgi:hypothetical protein